MFAFKSRTARQPGDESTERPARPAAWVTPVAVAAVAFGIVGAVAIINMPREARASEESSLYTHVPDDLIRADVQSGPAAPVGAASHT